MLFRTILLASLIATPLAAQSTMDHSTMDHSMHSSAASETPVFEQGQSAFAAIEEIIMVLDADPATDWSRIDIDGLREHLRDMDLVFTMAEATTEKVSGGLQFTVTGEGRIREAIRNMVLAHAGIMDGVDNWHYVAETHPEGATLTIIVPPFEVPRLTGLGFFGVMAAGMHHQDHHWMMATGMSPHH